MSPQLYFAVISTYFIIHFTNASESYPSNVCFIGNVSAEYESSQDPRSLMGSYTEMNLGNLNLNEDIVDASLPIYESSTEFAYLFKAKNLISSGGWVISSNLPLSGTSLSVYMTCFEENVLECTYNRWFWGYAKYENPITPVRVISGECDERMCIKNLALTLSNGRVPDISGEFTRTNDGNTGRYKWINQRDTMLVWIYRDQNWVYQENGADRVACSPGAAEMPLFCTTFLYASSDNELSRTKLGYSDTIFKLGSCVDTSAPTLEPTINPSSYPTRADGQCQLKNGQFIALGATTTVECSFGYIGSGDVGTCMSNGQIEWEYDCFALSFSDYFNEFDDSLWSVYGNEEVSGEAAIDLNGGTRFVPNSDALVGVFQSKEKINWPIRIRANVRKETNECNLFAISLGPKWEPRSEFSTRLQWSCLSGIQYKQMSLYNSSFRLYDATCWFEASEESMEIIYSVRNNSKGRSLKASMSASDCASLQLGGNEITTSSIWQDAYLWIGSYTNSDTATISDDIIGRFDSIHSTQFFTDFDGQMLALWDSFPSDYIDTDKEQLCMNPGQFITANSDYLQFEYPFMIKLGIRRNLVNGVYDKIAHFVSIGGNGYNEEPSANELQIVWDEMRRARLIFSETEAFADVDSPCVWNNEEEKATYEVTMYVYNDSIRVVDDVCNEYVMQASHSLNALRLFKMSIGFIDGNKYLSEDRVCWSYFEAYQLPSGFTDSLGEIDDAEIADDINAYFQTSAPTMQPTMTPTTVSTSTSLVATDESPDKSRAILIDVNIIFFCVVFCPFVMS